MPPESAEIVIALIAGATIFLVLSGIVVYILFFYQRKRFQHQQQVLELHKQFNEALLKSQIEMQEHNFSIISREIHDNVGQVLSLAKIQINLLNESSHSNGVLLNEVKENISKAMTDLRDISKGLNTERVLVSDLYETIRLEVDRISRSNILKGSLVQEGQEKEIGKEKKLILFRMIQECLQNILKHAEATTFSIHLGYEEMQLCISIQDNGKGFNLEEALAKKNGIGLSNIQSRSSLIGAMVGFESQPGNGTTISIKLPYD